jgi:hypothetical protein
VSTTEVMSPAPWSVPKGLRPRAVPDAPRLMSTDHALRSLTELDIEAVPPRVLADEVLVLFTFIDRLHALALERLARVDAHGVATHESGTTTASWLRHHSGLPSGTASDLVRTARCLRSTLPSAAQALRDGEITVQHTRTIARTARLVEERTPESARGEAVAHVETVMLDVARAVDAGSLGGFAQRVRQVVDPDGSLIDANRAHERRWLSTSKTVEGMVAIDGLLDPESGAMVLTALASATAPRGPDDHRSAGQRRADALVDMCAVCLDHGSLASSGGVRPHLLVTAPATSFATSGEVTNPSSTEVPEVSWTGPLPNASVRRLGCDADITRVLLDGDSLPLDVGRSTRTVPQQIRHALVVRDRGCVAEGCDRPVAWTEAHHVVHWAEGGRTALDNLVLLCRTHHRKVHDAKWEFTRIGDRWRLVPPPEQRLSYRQAGLDPRADRTPDQIRDAGSDGTQGQLPHPGEDP